jgi:hypothetical protein
VVSSSVKGPHVIVRARMSWARAREPFTPGERAFGASSELRIDASAITWQFTPFA